MSILTKIQGVFEQGWWLLCDSGEEGSSWASQNLSDGRVHQEKLLRQAGYSGALWHAGKLELTPFCCSVWAQISFLLPLVLVNLGVAFSPCFNNAVFP